MEILPIFEFHGKKEQEQSEQDFGHADFTRDTLKEK